MTRRELLFLASATLIPACAPSPVPSAPSHRDDGLDALEASLGGRVGVFALDTTTGDTIAHRADERFAMCSTFKWTLAAAILARSDRRVLTLDQLVPYGERDVLEHAPVTRSNLAAGAMSVESLAAAAVEVSDNTAANLLLSLVGGPAGLTEFLRGLGDTVTRLDRDEPTMNENLPGDPRDTTSPRAMVGTLKAVLLGEVLSPANRERLMGWLKSCETGLDRLRAGLPSSWTVGDKTGTGNRSAVNDVAIAIPPGRGPILVASYLSDSGRPLAALSDAHRGIARLVAARFSG